MCVPPELSAMVGSNSPVSHLVKGLPLPLMSETVKVWVPVNPVKV